MVLLIWETWRKLVAETGGSLDLGDMAKTGGSLDLGEMAKSGGENWWFS